MSEQDLTKAVIAAVNATYRAFVWRANSGQARGLKGGRVTLAPRGCPDVVGFMLRDGRMVGLELKAPGARTKPETAAAQEEWRKLMVSAGCLWGRVTSVDEAVRLVMGVR